MPTEVITVLGATGLLGSAVSGLLAERPVHLRLVSRRPAALPAGRAVRAGVEAVGADLTRPGVVADVTRDADAVFCFVKHTGGWREADTPAAARVNSGVMRALADAARRRGAGRPAASGPVVVYAGSASQAGRPVRAPLDGTEPDRPEIAFDRQKLAAERHLLAATRDGAVRGVPLRLPMVYGSVPGATDPGVVTAMARRALSGAELTVWDAGTVRRDLLHVTDAAAAFVAALDHADALAGRSWLVGTGSGVSLGDLFRAVADAVAAGTGAPAAPVVSVPAPAAATPADRADLVLDAQPFRAVTGWRPLVALPDGLRGVAAALT